MCALNFGSPFMKPKAAHSGIFRNLQTLVRMARLKESNPKLYDRIMEEQLGGREREGLDESRRSFLKGAAGAAAGAVGFEAIESMYRKAAAAGGQTVNIAIVGAGIAGLNC